MCLRRFAERSPAARSPSHTCTTYLYCIFSTRTKSLESPSPWRVGHMDWPSTNRTLRVAWEQGACMLVRHGQEDPTALAERAAAADGYRAPVARPWPVLPVILLSHLATVSLVAMPVGIQISRCRRTEAVRREAHIRAPGAGAAPPPLLRVPYQRPDICVALYCQCGCWSGALHSGPREPALVRGRAEGRAGGEKGSA
jgi:hypothetical protein